MKDSFNWSHFLSHFKVKKIEKEHYQKMNDKSRERLKREYLELRNIGLIFIDYVPYEKKAEMIDGLKELYRPEGEKQPAFFDPLRIDQVPDIKQAGIRGGGGIVPLGTIFSSDLSWEPLQGIQKKLPKEFLCVEVSVGQFVDCAYYLVYSCTTKEEYRNNDIFKVFIGSEDWIPYEEKSAEGKELRGSKPKGPQLEPTMQAFQKDMEEFLRQFSCGLFLNKEKKGQTCPNFKVMSVPKIDFNSFDTWEREHSRLLKFIGFNYFAYSSFDNILVGYYPESLFRDKPSSVFQGLVFLASIADFKGEGYGGHPEYEVFNRIEIFTVQSAAALLHSTYWPAFVMEILKQKWEKNATSLLENIRILKKQKKLISKDIYEKTLDSYRDFNQFYIDEIKNVDTLTQNTSWLERFFPEKSPLKSTRRFIDVFESLSKGSERLPNMEKEMLRDLKDRFELLFRYCDNLTRMSLDESNISLQRSMRRMTITMLILTMTTVILAIIDRYGSAIWKALF